jgi:hypothetical protein
MVGLPIRLAILGDATGYMAAVAEVKAGTADMNASFGRLGGGLRTATSGLAALGDHVFGVTKLIGGLAAADLAFQGIKGATDLQSQLTLLETAGTETGATIGKVRDGLESLAVSTGTSLDQLTSGMYIAEKAGLDYAHGGLDVVKAAAQGAAAEHVDLGTMVNALTSIMRSYNIPASQSVSVMNELVAVGGRTKDTMQNIAASLSTVLPVAASAHISFAQIGGALATLTSHGTSSEEAAQELKNAVVNLQAPSLVASKMMAQLGISSNDVSAGLGDGKRGLAGTMNYLSETVLHKMGPAGTVLLSTLNASNTASADAQTAFNGLDSQTQSLAASFVAGHLTLKQWRTGVNNLTPVQANLAKQWAAMYNSSHGFQASLKSGTPQALTYNSIMEKMLGGTTGLSVALKLGGSNQAFYAESIAKVNAAGKKNGANISTWAQTQKTFTIQLERFHEAIEVTAVKLGTRLLPYLTSMAEWLTNHVMELGHAATRLEHFLDPVMTAVKRFLPSLEAPFKKAAGDVKGFFDGFNADIHTDAAKRAFGILKVGAHIAGEVFRKDLLPAFDLIVANLPSLKTVAVDVIKIALGSFKLLDHFILNVIGPDILRFVQFLVKHKDGVKQIALAVGGLLLVLKVWRTAQEGLRILMAADPAYLLIAALVALGIGLTEAYKHSARFREVVGKLHHTFSAVTRAGEQVVTFVRTHWRAALTDLATPLRKGAAEVEAVVKGRILPVIKRIPGELDAFMHSKTGQTAFGMLKSGASDLGTFFTADLMPTIKNLVKLLPTIAKGIAPVIGVLIGGGLAAFKAFGSIMKDVIGPAIKFASAFLLRHRAAVKFVVEAVLSLIVALKILGPIVEGIGFLLELGPVGLGIAIIAALVIGVIEAYKHCRRFRAAIHDVVRAFHSVVNAGKSVVDWVKKHWPLLIDLMLAPWIVIPILLAKHWHAILTDVGKFVVGVISTVGRILLGLLKFEGRMFMLGVNLIIGFQNGILSMGAKLGKSVGDFFTKHVPHLLGRLFSMHSPSRLMHDMGRNVTLGFANGITSHASAVRSAVRGLAGHVMNGLSGLQVGAPQLGAASASGAAMGGLAASVGAASASGSPTGSMAATVSRPSAGTTQINVYPGAAASSVAIARDIAWELKKGGISR